VVLADAPPHMVPGLRGGGAPARSVSTPTRAEGRGGSPSVPVHPLTTHAKMLRLEMLKGEERHRARFLGELILDCRDCGREVHWVSASGVRPAAAGAGAARGARRAQGVAAR
jgi:hypothetical protein